MRSTIAILTLAAGCGREPTPDPIRFAPAVPPPPDSVIADPAPGADLWAGLVTAGACAEEGLEVAPAVVPTTIGDTELLLVHCAFYAYQGTFELWLHTGERFEPIRDDAGAPLRGLGVPVVEGDRFYWLEKDRGVGDCGTSRDYRFESGRMVLTEAHRRDCDGARGDPANPWSWPAMALSGTLTDLQDGDHGCYVILDGGEGHVGGFDLCDNAALRGKRVRITLAEQPWKAPSCQGEPDCTDTVPTDVVQTITAL